MSKVKIQVVLIDEELAFIKSLSIKVQENITYNYQQIELEAWTKNSSGAFKK